MSNIKKYICLLLCATMLFAGCAHNTDEKDDTNTDNFSYETIQLGYDAQPFFTEKIDGFASVGEGYYYWDNSSEDRATYLMYFDKESQKAVPVCSKADCKHTADDECDAVFGNVSEGTEFVSYLWYYNGNLYTFVTVNNFDVRESYIYQISLDGSTRTKYIKLFDGDIDGLTMYCHRGYVYAALNIGSEALELYRVKLEKNAEPEMVYSFKGVEVTLYDFLPYKNGLAFIYCAFTDNTYDDIESKILYYDPVTGEITELMEGVYADSFRIIDDNIYYTNGEEMYVYNINSKENELFYTFENDVFLSYDGRYLYGDVRAAFLEDMSEHYIYVLDLEGKLVDSIQVASDYICYFGDEDYMFQLFDLNEDLTRADGSVIKVFDKSQIGTGECEWIELPITN